MRKTRTTLSMSEKNQPQCRELHQKRKSTYERAFAKLRKTFLNHYERARLQRLKRRRRPVKSQLFLLCQEKLKLGSLVKFQWKHRPKKFWSSQSLKDKQKKQAKKFKHQVK